MSNIFQRPLGNIFYLLSSGPILFAVVGELINCLRMPPVPGSKLGIVQGAKQGTRLVTEQGLQQGNTMNFSPFPAKMSCLPFVAGAWHHSSTVPLLTGHSPLLGLTSLVTNGHCSLQLTIYYKAI